MEEGECPKVRKVGSASDAAGVQGITGSQNDSDTVGIGGSFTTAQRDDDDMDSSGHEDHNEVTKPLQSDAVQAAGAALSKNARKKLERRQQWEAGREQRKAVRREKINAKKQRKRDARREEEATAAVDVQEAATAEPQRKMLLRSTQLPVTFVIDCSWEHLMLDKERISLGSQLTRSYSDNYRAPFRAHLTVSSFGGQLKERFDTLLAKHHESWKGVRFFEEDFVEVAERARTWMTDPSGGRPAGGAFAGKDCGPGDGETVYLSSDSGETLTELKPYSTYIIGGLVDRNRHKGVCYQRALDRGVRTARLPIDEYMQMTGRAVLATNHVSEIMLRWLELGDWGQAFLKVMPKRKGGVLKPGPREKKKDKGVQEGDHSTTVIRRETDDGAGGGPVLT